MVNVCDCKSLNDGSIPSSTFFITFGNLWFLFFNSSVVEQMAVNHRAAGSNPAWGGLIFQGLNGQKCVIGLVGLEPTIATLWAPCSNQLNYKPTLANKSHDAATRKSTKIVLAKKSTKSTTQPKNQAQSRPRIFLKRYKGYKGYKAWIFKNHAKGCKNYVNLGVVFKNLCARETYWLKDLERVFGDRDCDLSTYLSQ